MSTIETSIPDANLGETPTEGTQRFFSRLLAALHHSRQLQATREIDRHRHLIEEARAYQARTGRR
jgi:hypothetical protein